MAQEQEQPGELIPLNRIRVETALSRYPIHRLSKHGDIVINIREISEDGEAAIRWEVSHNSKYGQPGPLAYKLDTLIINRRIEETTRPVPRIIRLGSLKELCRELGLSETGGNTNQIRNALYQNAFAGITAKTRYRRNGGTERNIEIADTRYGVILTGEKLPDGRTADAVYIVLHDFYREILDNAVTRPLDYDYLRDLPPVPQRFYELLSYNMYSTLKYERHRARLVYSEFCTHAPQTRYMEFDRVKKQMHKIHSVHRQSGYIAKVDYEQTVDGEGNPDWIMLYQPGAKAWAEYRAFMRRGPASPEIAASPAQPALSAPEPTQLDFDLPARRKPRRQPRAKAEPSPLEKEMIGRGITAAIAAALLAEHGEDAIRLQMDILDAMTAKKRDKIGDHAAYLVTAIRNGHAVPRHFKTRAEREAEAEAKRQQEQAKAEERRRRQEEEARQKAERKAVAAYWASLTPEQQAAHDAAAIAQAGAEERKLIEPGPMKKIGMGILRDNHTRRLLQAQGKLPPSRP